MKHYLRLVRIQNLLIVVFTQCLMRWAIIEPILDVNNFDLQFSNFNFWLLVLATVSLTAAGYVINDYFDTKTDILNRPDEVVVGKHISRRTAMTLHVILSITGIVVGGYISWRIGLYQLGIIYLIVSGILWYYSTTYKRQFLIGNIIVAVLTALVPLMVVLYEIPMLNNEYRATLISLHTNFNNIFFWVIGFSFFAFFTTLIREIIKDMEDFEGDSVYGRNTLPIVLGVIPVKVILVVLNLIVIGALGVVYLIFLWGELITMFYFIFALIIPVLFLIYKIIRAKTKSDYTIASLINKVIMLLGLLYSLVVYYIFHYQF